MTLVISEIVKLVIFSKAGAGAVAGAESEAGAGAGAGAGGGAGAGLGAVPVSPLSCGPSPRQPSYR